MTERKRISRCLAHMSEAGLEQKYIKEAFDTNWVVPLGPNVNAFEKDLEEFVRSCHAEINETAYMVPVYDSNYWLVTITIDPSVKIKGQENAYKTIVTGAVGGAAGVIHAAESATTDCQPNDNVEALRVYLDQAQIEARPVWKPMHKQPVYASAPAYVNGVSEAVFKVGMCLPAGPCVTDDDVKYIVDAIKSAIK